MTADTTTPLITEAVADLIGLAAAMAANNPEAFQYHNTRLDRLQVAKEERIRAVNLAIQVKMAHHRGLVDLAEELLLPGGGCGCGKGDSCCGGEAEEGGCCSEDGCGCS